MGVADARVYRQPMVQVLKPQLSAIEAYGHSKLEIDHLSLQILGQRASNAALTAAHETDDRQRGLQTPLGCGWAAGPPVRRFSDCTKTWSRKTPGFGR